MRDAISRYTHAQAQERAGRPQRHTPTPQAKVRRVCVLCGEVYTDPDDHETSAEHLRYVEESGAYAALDQFIADTEAENQAAAGRGGPDLEDTARLPV